MIPRLSPLAAAENRDARHARHDRLVLAALQRSPRALSREDILLELAQGEEPLTQAAVAASLQRQRRAGKIKHWRGGGWTAEAPKP